MRILAGCVLLASAILAPQQSSSEFHSLYGASDLERFTVRPGITLTVEYSSDRYACQLQIAAPRSIAEPLEQTKMLPEDETTQILNEVVPPNTRGARIPSRSGSFQSSITAFEVEEYENVTISRVVQNCKTNPATCVGSITIASKRKGCESLSK
jgi:hypothetical protein